MLTENWRPITIAPSLGKHLEKVYSYGIADGNDRNIDNHAYKNGHSRLTEIFDIYKEEC